MPVIDRIPIRERIAYCTNILIISVILIISLLGAPLRASTLSNAITWLLGTQDPSGLWGEQKKSPFRDATVVVEALAVEGGRGTVFNQGQTAIRESFTSSIDYFARQLAALSFGGGHSARPA